MKDICLVTGLECIRCNSGSCENRSIKQQYIYKKKINKYYMFKYEGSLKNIDYDNIPSDIRTLLKSKYVFLDSENILHVQVGCVDYIVQDGDYICSDWYGNVFVIPPETFKYGFEIDYDN